MRLIDDAIRYWQRVLSEAEWNEDEERARVARLSIDELVAERERGELYEISF